MGTAFTENEKQEIKAKLKFCAKECMSKYGIKKTTIDQLVENVGISKGSFYNFYPSKELLFFEVFEDFHSEIYGKCLNILTSNSDLSEKERVENALFTMCKLMQKFSIIDIVENELDYLLRKIPKDILKKHYHDDNVHIKEIIIQSGINVNKTPEFVSAVIRTIALTLSHKKHIGEEYYNDVLKLLIKGACNEIL